MLIERGADVIAVDRNSNRDGDAFTNVIFGTPKILQTEPMSHRTLLLCYPDDSNSMALKCLNYYKNDYVVHIGELLYTNGSFCGPPQSSWGKTSSADFHCVLIKKLPSFPFSNDYLTVWKRTSFIMGHCNELAKNENDSDSDSSVGINDQRVGLRDVKSHKRDNMGELDLWASIPTEEQIVYNIAAPCLQHLLR